MNCQEVFETGLKFHHYANTAYPLTPKSFMQYKLRDEAEIRSLIEEDLKGVSELSLYIHVPFCQSRCRFCEYTVLEKTTEDDENAYVELLLKEMAMYAPILKGKKIIGYDLGGGTPTKLSTENLRRITGAVRELFDVGENVVFSIETTPVIAANDPDKIRAVYEMGYRRISMGVQTVSARLLAELGREGSASLYEQAVRSIRAAGFERFNIDLMYGFLHQTDVDFRNTLQYAMGLGPEYITLYRNRYKGTKIESEAGGVSIYKAMHLYRIAHHMLTDGGYDANMGKNTFSRVPGDYGTSDYLTSRVIDGTPYVGMGLGAQSFGMNYLAYNLGAAEKRMERYRRAIEAGILPFQDIYRLPADESMAKMISVSFYFAFIDPEAFRRRFGVTLESAFPEEIRYVLEHRLMEYRDGRILLTDKGADFINGVIPLFYSDRSKEELKHAFSGLRLTDKNDEQIFLEAYNINDYERPSVAVDVAAFTIHAEEGSNAVSPGARKLSVLLIQRGEHPCLNQWALPGGFLKKDETVESCAHREIREETGLEPAALLPVGVFSEPGRDPRGWIISNAYTSIIAADSIQAECGDDAIAARWFEVDYRTEGENVTLTLKSDSVVLRSVLKETRNRFGVTTFGIIDHGGLAFDHCSIIASALSCLRNHENLFEIAFDFLPERFTLTSLQRVHEILLGISLLPANFRRKASSYIEETEEFTSCAEHRPARLYRKKQP